MRVSNPERRVMARRALSRWCTGPPLALALVTYAGVATGQQPNRPAKHPDAVDSNVSN